MRVYNHLEDNHHICDKAYLHQNMKLYYESIGQDPFISMPVTFHVKAGLSDPEFSRFTHYHL